LKQLEDYHGTELYRRLSKVIEITEAGQVLLRKIMPILEQISKLENGFQRSMPKAENQGLCIGGRFSPSAFLLPSLLSRFQRRFPRAQLELRTGASVHLERLVFGSQMDLAIIAQPARSDEVISEPLRTERLVCFAPAQHRLAKKNRVEISDLISEPLIVRGGKGIAGTTANIWSDLIRFDVERKPGRMASAITGEEYHRDRPRANRQRSSGTMYPRRLVICRFSMRQNRCAAEKDQSAIGSLC
jgi:DNA-binding transcriptional LysR family regulator